MDRRILLLSPHPDDIAWSLGGTVTRLRSRASLHALTFFVRTRYAPGDASHGRRRAGTVRRREEKSWAEQAGVALRRADLPDASLRGFDDVSELGADPEPAILATVAVLIERAIAGLRPDTVLAPLAAGGHVDHAAVHMAMRRSTFGGDLWWYEDLPYASVAAAEPAENHPLVVDISDYWPAKEAGIRCFASQLPETILPIAHRYAASAGGERIWTADPGSHHRFLALLV